MTAGGSDVIPRHGRVDSGVVNSGGKDGDDCGFRGVPVSGALACSRVGLIDPGRTVKLHGFTGQPGTHAARGVDGEVTVLHGSSGRRQTAQGGELSLGSQGHQVTALGHPRLQGLHVAATGASGTDDDHRMMGQQVSRHLVRCHGVEGHEPLGTEDLRQVGVRRAVTGDEQQAAARTLREVPCLIDGELPGIQRLILAVAGRRVMEDLHGGPSSVELVLGDEG
ncbi:hypothetical protein ACFFX0_27180 [Citricoccus parietis]|uniref:Uncharacterized protein n=1 Tax=Citricoccus parietis TaxID=592307 RepID=A0ABV5G6U9_9MICC